MGEAIMLRSGGGGAEKQPTSWRFLQAISANANFTMEKGKWYRIHVYGRSGNGGAIPNTQSYAFAGNGGGGSGGYSCSVLMEKKETGVFCTVNDAITSFGSYLSATAGGNGGAADRYTVGPGGAGGTASGGNQVNTAGFNGGAGGSCYNSTPGSTFSQSVGSPGARGGNNGGDGGSAAVGHFSNLSGAGGGARLPNSPYTGVMGAIGAGGNGAGYRKISGGTTVSQAATAGNTPPAWNATSPPVVYGGGGGGGSESFHVIPGGTGTPGLIIIEVGGG